MTILIEAYSSSPEPGNGFKIIVLEKRKSLFLAAPSTCLAMLPKLLFALCPLMGLSRAVNLYVASYAGNITTLSLLQNPDCTYNLTQTFTFNTSTHTPSWLTLNRQNNVLYMIDEAVNATNGTVVSYKTNYTGHLTEIQRIEDIGGGVYATFYGSGSALAVPH